MNSSATQNYFVLFGLPQACEVDMALLDANYRRLQAQWHPDRFVAAPAPERLAALQRAGIINEAYATLKSPLRRAAHLLVLNGIDTGAQGTARLDPAFLLAQMELREELEALRAAGELDALTQLQDKTDALRRGAWDEFTQLIQEATFDPALAAFHKLQFLYKLQDEIRMAEDSLLD